MLIDLTCPAEIFETVLPTEEIPAAGLALYNLSDRVIVSVEVTLKLLSGSGAEKDRVVYRARALNGRPHSAFRMNVPCAPSAAARRADVTIDKVWFNDNAVWRREQSSSVEYIPNDLPVSPALTNLKFTAGETAVGFPSQQDGLWVCVCGRPNPDAEDVCARCRRRKDLVFTRYNREAVDKQVAQREKQLDLATRNVREDTARMQRIREEEYNLQQSRKARRRRLALCFPLCIAILAAMLFGVMPVLRLRSADVAMENRDWSAAAETLQALGDFPGAAERLEECRWEEAKIIAGAAETAEELKEAADALRAVKGHLESLVMADEADLARARLALADKDPAAAREALSALAEDDPQRKELENEILFTEAKLTMAAEDYAAAREMFLSLKDVYVPEAGELASECVYIPASRLIDDGEYTAAIEEMSRIPEHPQSRMAILECHYRLAEAALEQEDLETASAEFLMAADYGDAESRMTQTVFALAEKTFEEGDVAGAQTLFASLPGYAPAAERSNECILLLAKQAISKKEYERASELLGSLPEGYPGTESLIPRAAYLAGTAAAKKKDYEKAVLYLERAGDYRDAESRLAQAVEDLIEARLDAGDAAGALELLPRITDSKNYKKLKQKAEYQDAVALAEAGGDPEELCTRFEAMGSYEDAKTWVKRMYYAQAEQAEKRNETLSAARLYAKAGSWNGASKTAAALYDTYYGERAAAAREAFEAEDYTLAVTLLETLDRTELPAAYSDLDTLYENACVKEGERLYQDGRPYEAAVYFRLADNPRKTARWLSAACYKILGTWTDRDGNTAAVFREDNTCDIGGETFTFLVSDSFTVKTETDGGMAATFRITNLTETRLGLRDMRQGHDASYDLRKQAEPAAADTGAPGNGTEDETGGEGDSEEQDFTVEDGE